MGSWTEWRKQQSAPTCDIQLRLLALPSIPPLRLSVTVLPWRRSGACRDARVPVGGRHSGVGSGWVGLVHSVVSGATGVPAVLVIYPRARRISAARLPGLLCAGHGGAPSFWVCCRASVNGMGPRSNLRTCFEGGKHCQCFVRLRCVNLYSVSLEERIERFLSGLQ